MKRSLLVVLSVGVAAAGCSPSDGDVLRESGACVDQGYAPGAERFLSCLRARGGARTADAYLRSARLREAASDLARRRRVDLEQEEARLRNLTAAAKAARSGGQYTPEPPAGVPRAGARISR